MKTQRLAIDPRAPQAAHLEQAAVILRAGGLVAFPTETVYGLGANALDETAVRHIFAAKQRPAHDPIIVHIAQTADLPHITHNPPPLAFTLAEAFWPGPLTLVLPKAAVIPPAITAAGPTVAVRVPRHPIARALLRAAAVPIGAPSANRFSHTSPTTAQHVWDDLAGAIDLILDGGPTAVGVESTVLDLTTPVPTLLRPGGVSLEALRRILGEEVQQRTRESITPTAFLPSPGLLERHYAPHTPLTLYTGSDRAVRQQLRHANPSEALLLADEDVPHLAGTAAQWQSVGSLHDLEGVAHNLFRVLRGLDTAGATRLLARDFPPHGLGLAVRDRLRRAAVRIVACDEAASDG